MSGQPSSDRQRRRSTRQPVPNLNGHQQKKQLSKSLLTVSLIRVMSLAMYMLSGDCSWLPKYNRPRAQTRQPHQVSCGGSGSPLRGRRILLGQGLHITEGFAKHVVYDNVLTHLSSRYPCNLGCHRATILMLAPCCLVSPYNPITAHILTLTFRNMVTLVVAMEWDFGGFISQFFE